MQYYKVWQSVEGEYLYIEYANGVFYSIYNIYANPIEITITEYKAGKAK